MIDEDKNVAPKATTNVAAFDRDWETSFPVVNCSLTKAFNVEG